MYWRKSATIIVILVLTVAPSMALARTTAKPKVVPYGVPVDLRIPRLGVKASIEKTGVDRAGQLEAPKNPKQVGWYRNGTIPGKRGNAVIGGHVDWYDGPAVFRGLGRLRRGDIVEVKNDYGRVLKFRVTDVGTYVNGALPLQRVVGKSRGYNLNLYTCDGVFDRNARDYSRRVIVYTELVR